MSNWDFNLYDELDITKTATQDEIKKAYRKMAVKWHPDKNQGNPEATERFQRISHAYTILSDEKKRSYYDKYGKVDEDNFDYEEFMKGFSFNFGDIFGDNFMFAEQMFGEGRHAIKLMSIRKKFEGKEYDVTEECSGKLPTYIYGKGKGFDCKKHLSSFYINELEDDWEFEEENEEHKDDKDGSIEECDDEDVFEFFVSSNCTTKGKKVICNYCKKNGLAEDAYSFEKKTINQHYIDSHKIQFEEFFGTEVSWEETLETERTKAEEKKKEKKNKKKAKKQKNPFGGMPGMGGMPFMFDMSQMGNMGQMFAGMSEEEHQMMMDDFEKMMGGMNFGGGFPGFPGFK